MENRLQKSIKTEQDEGLQVIDSNINGPPPGFPPLAHMTSSSLTTEEEAIRQRRNSRKEYSRRYRQRKKAELEDLKRERHSLQNEYQSLQTEIVHLKVPDSEVNGPPSSFCGLVCHKRNKKQSHREGFRKKEQVMNYISLDSEAEFKDLDAKSTNFETSANLSEIKLFSAVSHSLGEEP